MSEKNDFLSMLEEAEPKKEKEMTNDEFLKDYFIKTLKCHLAFIEDEYRDSDDLREDAKNITAYLKLIGVNVSNIEPWPLDEAVDYYENCMSDYGKREREKGDSKFLNKVYEALEKEELIGYGFEFAAFIKALAEITNSQDGGFNKIIMAIKVLMNKSENVMPTNPEKYAHDVCVLNDMIDSIVEYGIKNNIV